MIRLTLALILTLGGLALLAWATPARAEITPDGDHVPVIRPVWCECNGPSLDCGNAIDWFLGAGLVLTGVGGLRFWPWRKKARERDWPERDYEHTDYTWGTEEDAEAARQALARMPESMRRRQ